MKRIIKAMSILLAVALMLSLTAVVAFAATAEKGTLTIENASAGVTYEIYKLFDAVLADAQNGPVVYTGDIPEVLAKYFTKDPKTGYITANQSNALSDAVITDMVNYVNDANLVPTAQATAEGDTLVFEGLDFGYYIVKSGLGAAISVDTTNPHATIKDKNTADWLVRKVVDDQNVSIGDTVTYELNIRAVNWFGDKKVTKYTITDTLPDFLSDVEVTSIKVQKDNVVYFEAAENDRAFDANKTITLPWVDENGEHMYPHNAVIIVTYTAKVTKEATVDGDGNTNIMTAKVYVDNQDTSYDEKSDYVVFWTYGTAVKKVDQQHNALSGAEFAANGLQVENVDGVPGLYRVTHYDPDSTVIGTTMTTDDNGNLVITGLCSDHPLIFTELVAPDGYNLLTTPVTVYVYDADVEIVTTVDRTWYDASGNVVNSEQESTSVSYVINYPQELASKALATNMIVNQAGVELPETGGIGTKLFIAFGSVTALGAAVILVARKKSAGYR